MHDLLKTLQDHSFFFFFLVLVKFVEIRQPNLIGHYGNAPNCLREGHNIVCCSNCMIQLEQGHRCVML